jgi:molybdopterin-guanine dinucleotide biosynthesis protein A
VVLAGGRSARMGRDKTRLPVGGVPLIERVLRVVRPLFAEVWVAGGAAGRFADLAGVREAVDPIPDGGPLAGIRAGLAACAAPWAFVVAADMPDLDPALIRRVARLATGDVRLVLPRRGPHVEPLHAAYRRDLLGTIDGMLARGERRPRLLSELVPVRYADLDERELRSLRNVNRPEDVAG